MLLYWHASGCYELSYVDCVLIPVDRDFLVKVYSYRDVGYLFLMVWRPVRFVLNCCNTVLRSPDLSDCVLVVLLFVLFASYLQTTVLVFFSFYAVSFTEACFYRCVLDMFISRVCYGGWFSLDPFFVCTLALSFFRVYACIVFFRAYACIVLSGLQRRQCKRTHEKGIQGKPATVTNT